MTGRKSLFWRSAVWALAEAAHAAERPAGIALTDATAPIGMETALSMVRLGAVGERMRRNAHKAGFRPLCCVGSLPAKNHYSPNPDSGKVLKLTVRELLNGVDIEPPRKRDELLTRTDGAVTLFISYAHKDNPCVPSSMPISNRCNGPA